MTPANWSAMCTRPNRREGILRMNAFCIFQACYSLYNQDINLSNYQMVFVVSSSVFLLSQSGMWLCCQGSSIIGKKSTRI